MMNNEKKIPETKKDDLHVLLTSANTNQRRFHQSAIPLCIDPSLPNSLATPISITNPCMVWSFNLRYGEE